MKVGGGERGGGGGEGRWGGTEGELTVQQHDATDALGALGEGVWVGGLHFK